MSILNGASALGSAVYPEPDQFDPKVLAGSGSGKHHSGSEQLLIRNESEVKLLWKTDKIFHFPPKICNLKM
jgi:hypothetical protein